MSKSSSISILEDKIVETLQRLKEVNGENADLRKQARKLEKQLASTKEENRLLKSRQKKAAPSRAGKSKAHDAVAIRERIDEIISKFDQLDI